MCRRAGIAQSIILGKNIQLGTGNCSTEPSRAFIRGVVETRLGACHPNGALEPVLIYPIEMAYKELGG